MAYELPTPRSATDAITESMRQRIALLARPTLDEELAPQLLQLGARGGGGPHKQQNVTDSVAEAFKAHAEKQKQKSVKAHMDILTKYASMNDKEKSHPGNKQAALEAMLILGLDKVPSLEKTEKPKEPEIPGAKSLTYEQLSALQSGDNLEMSKNFPGGVPLQAVRFGTQFSNARNAEAERDD